MVLAGSGCSAGPVDVGTPTVSGADRRACEGLVGDLPDTLAEESAREVSPADALGAAWGDPAITLTCGVGRPAGFDRFSTCMQADGVGWFVPDDQLLDESTDVTMTAVGYRPRVQVDVPASYRPEGVAAAMSELAGPVDDHLRLVKRCR